MNTLSYGLHDHVTPTATAAFGARAILRNGVIDWVPDRGDLQYVVVEDKAALMSWMKGTGEPWLSKQAKNIHNNSPDVVALDDERFHLRASTNASCGYLYVAAWTEGEGL